MPLHLWWNVFFYSYLWAIMWSL